MSSELVGICAVAPTLHDLRKDLLGKQFTIVDLLKLSGLVKDLEVQKDYTVVEIKLHGGERDMKRLIH